MSQPTKKAPKKQNEGGQVRRGIFKPESNFSARALHDYVELKKLIRHCRGLGLRLVLTQGTYDMIHIGHARYLEEAKRHGDFLIVGVDSDDKVKKRKGPDRPVVPHHERMEMLCHLRPVDVVFLKHLGDPKWSLIRAVRPDVLIATKETYNESQLAQLKNYCGRVEILNPMAATSTSAKIRLMHIGTAEKLERTLTPKLLSVIEEALREVKGTK